MKAFYVIEKEELETLLKNIISEVIDSKLLELQQSLEFSNQKDLCGIEEASKYLGITKSTMYGLTSRREIPHRKLGKKLLFSIKEINEWILRESIHHRTIKERAEEYLRKSALKKLK